MAAAAAGMSALVAVAVEEQLCHCDAEEGDLGGATLSGARCDGATAGAASEEKD